MVFDTFEAPRASVTVSRTEYVPRCVNVFVRVTFPGAVNEPLDCPFPVPQSKTHAHGPSPTSGSEMRPRIVTLLPRVIVVAEIAASVTDGGVFGAALMGVTVQLTA